MTATKGQEVSDPLDTLAFARTTIAAGFDGLAQVPGLGLALGGLIVAGLLVAWRGRPFSEVRKVAAALGLLACCLVAPVPYVPMNADIGYRAR